MATTRRRRVILTLRVIGFFVAVGVVLWTSFPLARLPQLQASARTDIVLEDVVLLNPGTPRREHVDVQVVDGKIAAIRPSKPRRSARPPRYVLPGFVDVATHTARFSPDVPLWKTLYLVHGVTSVRDVGPAPVAHEGDAKMLGEKAGPRRFACGPVLDGAGSAIADATEIAGEAAARAAVRDLAAKKADCVAVGPRLDAPTAAAVKDEAARAELPVVAIAGAPIGDAVTGYTEARGMSGVADAPGAPWTDDAAWTPWTGALGATTPARIDAIAATAKARGIAVTPSLVAWDGLARLGDPARAPISPAPGGAAATAATTTALLPDWYTASAWTPARPLVPYRGACAPALYAAAGRAFPAIVDAVGRLARAGVALRVGTEAGAPFVVPGASFDDELRLLVRAGLTPEQALAAATRGGAEALPRAGVGVLREGGPADLLLFHEDPTTSLDRLNTLDLVMVDGRGYHADDLRKLAEQQRDGASSVHYAIARGVFAVLTRFSP